MVLGYPIQVLENGDALNLILDHDPSASSLLKPTVDCVGDEHDGTGVPARAPAQSNCPTQDAFTLLNTHAETADVRAVDDELLKKRKQSQAALWSRLGRANPSNTNNSNKTSLANAKIPSLSNCLMAAIQVCLYEYLYFSNLQASLDRTRTANCQSHLCAFALSAALNLISAQLYFR
jgi:hypothetical protein